MTGCEFLIGFLVLGYIIYSLVRGREPNSFWEGLFGSIGAGLGYILLYILSLGIVLWLCYWLFQLARCHYTGHGC